MDHIYNISEFVLKSFLHIWPYLLISIPLAVIVNLSGAAKHISRALNRKPLVSVFLATAIGAISPFCSCGVIPVIASLLMGGVPLAPVMSFWIASPSMDPEVFFLSVATIGWELSFWRLGATFAISLSAGIITHFIQKKGFFGNEILRVIKNQNFQAGKKITAPSAGLYLQTTASTVTNNYAASDLSCCIPVAMAEIENSSKASCLCDSKKQTDYANILKECFRALLMVTKFMVLAFFINALIHFYVPGDFISRYVSMDSSISIPIAALTGIPFYTSNVTALPLVSGFLSIGMNKGAILAFLIAGPVTTLPAMAAVWGIVKPRVFLLFLAFGLIGSIISGYLFILFN